MRRARELLRRDHEGSQETGRSRQRVGGSSPVEGDAYIREAHPNPAQGFPIKPWDPSEYARYDCDTILNEFQAAESLGDWDPLSVMNYNVELWPGAYEFTELGLRLLHDKGVTPKLLGATKALSEGDIEAIKRAQCL